MKFVYNCWKACFLLLSITVVTQSAEPSAAASTDDYNVQHNDGSFEFGYDTKDHFHHADGTKDNFVRGQFGSRNPATGQIDTTSYTAGPRGFRPRGKNIHRKYDLNQVGPRPVGSKDDPLYDPSEDPSYSFSFRTRAYNRQEAANRVGDVTGRYSYLDDVGERHNVEYVAGKNTGFHVRTPYPDSNPRALGPLYFQGPGKPPRGRTSIQRGLDGSYRFVSAGPDQRRTETSDANGHVRGSYTFIDDKGTQHTVHYIAGPETGYRVLKNVKGPHFPNWYPFGLGRPGYPVPDYSEDYADTKNEDIFENPKEHLNTAASGHIKPSKNGGYGPSSGGVSTFGSLPDKSDETGGLFDDKPWDKFDNSGKHNAPKKPSYYTPSVTKRPQGGINKKPRPFLEDDGYSSSADDDNFDDDLFKPSASGDSSKPSKDITAPERPISHNDDDDSGSSTGRPTGRPTTTSFFDDDLPKPFDVTLNSNGDDDDLFGGSKGSGSNKGVSGNKGSSSSTNDRYGGSSSSNDRYGGSSSSNDRYGSSSTSNDRFGGADSASSTHRPRPTYNNNDDNLGEPVHIGATFDGKGTILKNIGDKFISFPPGIAVRAHVQSIDILPYGSRLPSPSEQLKSESSNLNEDKKDH